MKNPEFNQDFKEWLEALENTILTDGELYTSELLQKIFQLNHNYVTISNFASWNKG